MKSFRAIVTKDKDGVAISCPELELHTCGDTLEEAKSNFSDLLIEYFEFLVENRKNLSNKFLKHLKIYKEAILEKGIEWF
ncbi:MAG: type II toxin-antitoxin system HicB family antitoxin, partial [bacterium]